MSDTYPNPPSSNPESLPQPPALKKRRRGLIILLAIGFIVIAVFSLPIFSPRAKKRTVTVPDGQTAAANPEQVYGDIQKEVDKTLGAPKETLASLKREQTNSDGSGIPAPTGGPVTEPPPVRPADSPVFTPSTDQISPPSPTTAPPPPSPATAGSQSGANAAGSRRSHYFRLADETPKPAPSPSVPPLVPEQVSSPNPVPPVVSAELSPPPPVARPLSVKPPFGATLPVRLLGAAASLFPDALVRLELTRDVSGPGWRLPRGAQFIGRLGPAAADRLSVTVFGLLDPAANRLIQLGGNVLATDGAAGLPGQRKRLEPRVGAIVSRAFSAALQLGNSFLLGRRGGNGALVIPPIGERDIADFTGFAPAPTSQNPTFFVTVPAGAEGYVFITDLPPSENVPAAAPDDPLRAAARLERLTESALRAAAAENPTRLRSLAPTLDPAFSRPLGEILAAPGR
jgi:hypothetical protein